MKPIMFKAIFGNGTSHAETIPTSSYNRAVAAMNELLDNFKYGDNGYDVRLDAKYFKGVPQIWLNEHPDAIVLRVLHVQPNNCEKTHRVMGKVVMC